MNILFEGRDRTGELLLVREATERDAAAWLAHTRRTVAETPFLLQSSDDPLPSLGEQERVLGRYAARPGCLALLAEHPGRRGRQALLGTLTLLSGATTRLLHVSELSMAVARAAWGRGIGDALLATAIEAARRDALTTRLSLQVFASNTPARALYRKHGFVEEGWLHRYVRVDGRHEDIVPMGLDLGDATSEEHHVDAA
jgi:RimJ/RimL family protein N-acetyltransferase